MQAPANPIVLCEYRDRRGRNELSAVLDEVTLTYTVVLRDTRGATHAVRQYLPTLRAARAWAFAYRNAAMPS
jgi:hypothetical protein